MTATITREFLPYPIITAAVRLSTKYRQYKHSAKITQGATLYYFCLISAVFGVETHSYLRIGRIPHTVPKTESNFYFTTPLL